MNNLEAKIFKNKIILVLSIEIWGVLFWFLSSIKKSITFNKDFNLIYLFKFKTNYWKLDAQSLTIYDSAKQEVKLKEIQIDQIKSASSADLDDKFINDQKCLFIIKTNDETFFCGDGSMALYSSVNSAVRNFHNLLKMALLPFSNRKLGKTS